MMTRSRIRRTPSRNVAKILARLEQRSELPKTYAPDFLHGDFCIEEAYEGAASATIEDVAFLLYKEDELRVAIIKDHFLTIYSHALDSTCANWLERLLEESKHALVYDLREGHQEHRSANTSHLEIDHADFLVAERRILNIEREGDESANTTLLSMIGFFVRSHHFGRELPFNKAA